MCYPAVAYDQVKSMGDQTQEASARHGRSAAKEYLHGRRRQVEDYPRAKKPLVYKVARNERGNYLKNQYLAA